MAQKMTGALVFDERTDRYDIRFDLNSYYGGLHCGECFDVFVRGKWNVKSHIVYRLCNHMVYTLSLIQPGVIVQEIALFECVNSLVQVDAADSELSEHQCDLPRERRLANGDAFPTKPFA